MVYEKPSYEEYCKASAYARIRYRYGVFIQLVAMILILILFIYAALNVEEMKANPKDYAEKKLGVFCTYPLGMGQDYINGSIGNITGIREG